MELEEAQNRYSALNTAYKDRIRTMEENGSLSYAASPGNAVSGGQLIGHVGNTGIATGNHLHFGIAYNGQYINPCSLISF